MQTQFCRQHRRQLFCLDNCYKSTPNYRELPFSESTFWLIFRSPNDTFLRHLLQGFRDDFCRHFLPFEAVQLQRQVYYPPRWVGWKEQRKQGHRGSFAAAVFLPNNSLFILSQSARPRVAELTRVVVCGHNRDEEREENELLENKGLIFMEMNRNSEIRMRHMEKHKIWTEHFKIEGPQKRSIWPSGI